MRMMAPWFPGINTICVLGSITLLLTANVAIAAVPAFLGYNPSAVNWNAITQAEPNAMGFVEFCNKAGMSATSCSEAFATPDFAGSFANRMAGTICVQKQMDSKENADMLAKMLNTDPHKMALYSVGGSFLDNAFTMQPSDPMEPKRRFTRKDIEDAKELAGFNAGAKAIVSNIGTAASAVLYFYAIERFGGMGAKSGGEPVKIVTGGKEASKAIVGDIVASELINVSAAIEAAKKEAEANPGNHVKATGEIIEEPEITEPAKPPEDESTPLLDAEDAGTTVLRRCMQEEAAKITKQIGTTDYYPDAVQTDEERKARADSMLQQGVCDTKFYGREFCHGWRRQRDSVPVNTDDA
ncbi:hypothetical protein QFC22_006744 [Naganishia vaughanmartiniae]|uniref:Uncharacterized protein n=1 Tax=Naganishia vaughanmartiniae TaxID=1424756 RepID=A0ACC2WGX2_9TREE|nr:hypothetical protein QFC22_006744 [Naganishia vaughanmartiniae]